MKDLALSKRAAFAVVAAAVVLGAVELAARWLAPVPKEAQFGQRIWVIGEILRFDRSDSPWVGDPDLLWRLAPHSRVNWGDISAYDGVMVDGSGEVNAYGWRGPEVTAKHPGELRVLNLGDSCTWGIGAHRDDAYSARLAGVLAARTGRRWSSVNAGVPSYSSLQGKRLLARYAGEIEPDFVTIYFGWNDSWATSPDARNRLMEPSPAGALMRALYRSEAFDQARLAIFNLFPERNVARVSVTEFHDNLLEIIERARSTGAVPILVTPPAGPEPGSLAPAREPANREYVAMVRTVARETGMPLVDVVADFESEHPLYFHDPIHPNAAGHERIATLLADAIVARVAPP